MGLIFSVHEVEMFRLGYSHLKDIIVHKNFLRSRTTTRHNTQRFGRKLLRPWKQLLKRSVLCSVFDNGKRLCNSLDIHVQTLYMLQPEREFTVRKCRVVNRDIIV